MIVNKRKRGRPKSLYKKGPKKRDRSLSKLIDFQSEEQKERAQSMADTVGIPLKQWIEELIAMKTGVY
jgi:hypothetical protein